MIAFGGTCTVGKVTAICVADGLRESPFGPSCIASSADAPKMMSPLSTSSTPLSSLEMNLLADGVEAAGGTSERSNRATARSLPIWGLRWLCR
eukprot:3040344-Prymnesium_polylepis.1